MPRSADGNKTPKQARCSRASGRSIDAAFSGWKQVGAVRTALRWPGPINRCRVQRMETWVAVSVSVGVGERPINRCRVQRMETSIFIPRSVLSEMADQWMPRSADGNALCNQLSQHTLSLGRSIDAAFSGWKPLPSSGSSSS